MNRLRWMNGVNTKLLSSFELARITPMVEYREDNKSVRFNRIMDRVRKPFEQRTAHARTDGAKTLRVGGDA